MTATQTADRDALDRLADDGCPHTQWAGDAGRDG